MNIHQKINAIVDWLYREIPKDLKILVPVSGGSDSALCFWLCSQAFPNKTQGVYIGKPEHLRAEEWFRKTGPMCIESPLIPDLDPTQAEIMRWAHFQILANLTKKVLVGSRNRTEHTLGTYSLASRVATHLPIVGLWKSEVLEMCEHIGVPQEIITASSLPDVDCGRTPELAVIPVDLVDYICKTMVGDIHHSRRDILTGNQGKYLYKIYVKNKFKQLLPKHGPIV